MRARLYRDVDQTEDHATYLPGFNNRSNAFAIDRGGVIRAHMHVLSALLVQKESVLLHWHVSLVS